jgi:preprotein translocase subunit SecG
MGFVTVLLGILLFVTAVFLIVLVLIQRGKGGGLAGAFGGMGGQSAFGTKAGDLFTRITIGVAAFWIILCIIGVKVFGIGGEGPLGGGSFGTGANKQLPGASAPANTDKSTEGGKGAGAPAPVTPPKK